MKTSVIILLVLFLFGCGNAVKQPSTTNVDTPYVKEEPAIFEGVPVINEGFQFPIEGKTGNILITFTKVSVVTLPSNTFNIQLEVLIKNNITDVFPISAVKWKLVNEKFVEVEESGYYDPEMEMFDIGMFWFTVVDPGFGKVAKVGYHVPNGKYYLTVLGEVIGQFVI